MIKNLSLCLFYFFLAINPLLADQNKPVLGVSSELTGGASAYGLDIQDMITFANEKLANNKYQLDFQDDKCDPKSAVDVAKYFTELKRPLAVIGYGCSGPMLSAGPILEKASLLTMVIFASSPRISSAGKFIFRSMPNDKDSGEMLANWILKQGKRKVGVLSAETDYCQEIKEIFSKTLEKGSVKVSEEDYLTTEVDFKPYLLKLKRAGVDSIFLNGQTEGSVEIMLKNLATLQWRPQIYCAYFPSSRALLAKTAPELEGTEFVDLPNVEDVINEEGKKLYKEYTARFGSPRSVPATFVTVFEGFRALHLALESKNNPREFLLKTKFKGIFGEYSFNSQGQITGLSFAMKKIKNGEVVAP